ncbi:MAG TPA: recombination mediator RecR [Isosphaeraceae bacterium]|jgi:recombination protein RecR
MPGDPGTVDRLIGAFGRLPGVGAKTAERLAHHILKCPAEEALALADAIREAKDRIRHCQACFHLTEADQPRCAICRDPRRDPGLICVVEQPRDLLAMERAGSYSGVYHVLLGRLAPLQGLGPDQLTVDALEARVRAGGVRELILATNPNLEGDGTALFVAGRLAATGVPITRLARGLASGGALEFANKEMLADAIQGRQRF